MYGLFANKNCEPLFAGDLHIVVPDRNVHIVKPRIGCIFPVRSKIFARVPTYGWNIVVMVAVKRLFNLCRLLTRVFNAKPYGYTSYVFC